MTAPEMDPRTGLLPDQAWSVPSGPRWQARLWADGRAHVIGEALASHTEYRHGYMDSRIFGLPVGERRDSYVISRDGQRRTIGDAERLGRRWHADHGRAMRAASLHERMVVAAERQGVA